MIGAIVSFADANEMSRDRSYAEEMFAGFSPEGSAKVVLSSPSSTAFSFIRSMKEAVPPCETRASDAGGGVIRGNQREVQDIVQRNAIVGAQIGGRRCVDIATLDGDFLREVGIIFEEHQGRHHLGDAGDRALVLRVLFPQNLTRLGIENDGGGSADIGDQRAVRVRLEPGTHRFLERLEPGLFAGPGSDASTGEAGLPSLGGRGRVGRLPRDSACGLLSRRAFSQGGRDDDAKRDQHREQSSYVQRADQAHVSSDTTAAGWDSTVAVNWNAHSVATMPRHRNEKCNSAVLDRLGSRVIHGFLALSVRRSIQNGYHHSHIKRRSLPQRPPILNLFGSRDENIYSSIGDDF